MYSVEKPNWDYHSTMRVSIRLFHTVNHYFHEILKLKSSWGFWYVYVWFQYNVGPVLYCHDTVVLLPFLYGGHQYHTESSKATVDPLDTLHLLSLRKKNVDHCASWWAPWTFMAFRSWIRDHKVPPIILYQEVYFGSHTWLVVRLHNRLWALLFLARWITDPSFHNKWCNFYEVKISQFNSRSLQLKSSHRDLNLICKIKNKS